MKTIFYSNVSKSRTLTLNFFLINRYVCASVCITYYFAFSGCIWRSLCAVTLHHCSWNWPEWLLRHLHVRLRRVKYKVWLYFLSLPNEIASPSNAASLFGVHGNVTQSATAAPSIVSSSGSKSSKAPTASASPSIYPLSSPSASESTVATSSDGSGVESGQEVRHQLNEQSQQRLQQMTRDLDKLGKCIRGFMRSYRDEITKSLKLMAHECSSLDNMHTFCAKSSLESYADSFHPFLSTIVNWD